MNNLQNFYVTTAIHYANAKPHIGHAFENILADVLFRFQKDLLGHDSYFLTGTDEHGQKIDEKAKEMGFESTQDFVDENSKYFQQMNDLLLVEPSNFIRTSSEYHKLGAKYFWNKLVEKGDIYKDSYSGYYCVGCEAYYLEKDLSEGLVCPIHLKKIQEFSEENYFFALSKYSEKIKDIIQNDIVKIRPESRKREFLSVLEEGLTDVSFSRQKEKMSWGVDVPNDEKHVMYVWCDALTNYITALGYGHESLDMQKFWPADKHIVGKDILRFHAGIWLGMLLSAEIDLPLEICVHGFLLSNGHKMSKSLGNVVDPIEVAEKFGAEVLRYFLVREIPTGEDGDFNMERFQVVYESDLQNNYGNLLSRTISMVNKYLDGVIDLGNVSKGEGFEFMGDYEDAYQKYLDGMMNFELRNSFEAIMKFLSKLNLYVETNKPWDLYKNEKHEELKLVMTNLIYGLILATRLLYPVMPVKTKTALELLGVNNFENFLNLNSMIEDWLSSKGLVKVAEKVEPLFPRFEWE